MPEIEILLANKARNLSKELERIEYEAFSLVKQNRWEGGKYLAFSSEYYNRKLLIISTIDELQITA